MRAFAAFLGRSPDTATADDLRRWQLHQRERGAQAPSFNSSVSALRFFLARRLVLARQPRKLPSVLTPFKIQALLEAAPGPKAKAAMAEAYGAGTRYAQVATRTLQSVISPLDRLEALTAGPPPPADG